MKKDSDKNFQRKIDELEARAAELTAGWQRTQADFVNYKKQSAEERLRLIETANADLISSLLPVLDNFQLATRHLPENLAGNNWVQGISQIEKQFENILIDSGLERIETLGTQFDPELHEAVEAIDSDKPSGEIIEEVSAGYKYDNIVLRPARVKVSK